MTLILWPVLWLTMCHAYGKYFWYFEYSKKPTWRPSKLSHSLLFILIGYDGQWYQSGIRRRAIWAAVQDMGRVEARWRAYRVADPRLISWKWLQLLGAIVSWERVDEICRLRLRVAMSGRRKSRFLNAKWRGRQRCRFLLIWVMILALMVRFSAKLI